MPRTVRAACLLSFLIGLSFVFIRAPHPWGWNGFDHYHELALTLAAAGWCIVRLAWRIEVTLAWRRRQRIRTAR